MATAWSLYSIDDPQHAGNTGYDDRHGRSYTWDNTVANHGRPAVGDLAVVRNDQLVEGSGWIERIEYAETTKQRRRCPQCGTTDIKRRKVKRPLYRCGHCHQEFDTAAAELIEILQYTAVFGDSWRSSNLPVERLEEFIPSRARQHAIREMPLEAARSLCRQ